MATEERKEKMRAYTKVWYQKNKEHKASYYKENKEHYAKIGRDIRQAIKVEVLTHYGGGKLACAVCGESRIACLSLDHIDYIGKHSQRKSPITLYRQLRAEEYPEGYMTLCMNCQFVKREVNKEYLSK